MSSSTDPAAYRLTLERFLHDAARFGGIAALVGLTRSRITRQRAACDTLMLFVSGGGEWHIDDANPDGLSAIALDLRGGDATPDELRAALEAELVPSDAIFETAE